MHTADELEAADFDYRADGKSVSRREVLPPIGLTDRVGVVMGVPTEGLDAGNFVLSGVTAFYDRLRETAGDFFEYPGFYTFQVATDPADYMMLDIYPDHKNVAVDADGETLVRAVADRAIDVLLVPNRPTGSPDIADVTRRSVERQVECCYQYAGAEPLAEFDFTIGLPRSTVEPWYAATVDSVDEPSATERQTVVGASGDGDQITQRFRRVGLERALASLPEVGE